MNCLQVLRRLREIERAIGVLDSVSIRRMIIEAEDCVFELQKEAAKTGRLNGTRTAER